MQSNRIWGEWRKTHNPSHFWFSPHRWIFSVPFHSLITPLPSMWRIQVSDRATNWELSARIHGDPASNGDKIKSCRHADFAHGETQGCASGFSYVSLSLDRACFLERRSRRLKENLRRRTLLSFVPRRESASFLIWRMRNMEIVPCCWICTCLRNLDRAVLE